MSTVSAGAPAHRSGWTITEGVVLIIVGIMALAAPLVTANVASVILPVLLLVEGIVLIVSAFSGRTFGSATWHVILGIIALIASAALFMQPVLAIASLPIILGVYLLFKGIAQFAIGASMTGSRAWIYTAAVLNIVFALLLFAQPFGASLVLTGLYIGVSILVLGVLLLMAPASDRSDTAM